MEVQQLIQYSTPCYLYIQYTMLLIHTLHHVTYTYSTPCYLYNTVHHVTYTVNNRLLYLVMLLGQGQLWKGKMTRPPVAVDSL